MLTMPLGPDIAPDEGGELSALLARDPRKKNFSHLTEESCLRNPLYSKLGYDGYGQP